MRTAFFDTTGSRSARAAVAAALVVLLVVPRAGVTASGPVTSAGCFASKAKEWGKRRKCEASEQAKILLGRSSDVTRCQTRFTAKLTVLDSLAATAGVPCRWRDNGDGTATDYDTGLQWERKTDDGSIHDRNLGFQWSSGCLIDTHQYPDGAMFTEFLGTLNENASVDGATVMGGFAGHADWRIPTLAELVTIGDLFQPNCPASDCIGFDETVFGPGPDDVSNYVTSTVEPLQPGFPYEVWGISFAFLSPYTTPRSAGGYVRAVRNAF